MSKLKESVDTQEREELLEEEIRNTPQYANFVETIIKNQIVFSMQLFTEKV